MVKASLRRTAVALFLVGLLAPPWAGLAVPAWAQSATIDYSKGKGQFPNLFAPYTPVPVPPSDLTNSTRLDDLIHEGKLYLSMQDAIYLALENNLDIAADRYGPDLADTDILRAKGGAVTRGTGGVGTASALGVSSLAALDPTVTSTLMWERATFPVNNAVTSGVGLTPSAGALTQQLSTANFAYTQGFVTGTSYTVTLNNQRQSTTSPFNFFNPANISNLEFSVTQPLLNGFGFAQNKRFIRVAKNNRKISDQAFAQQVMDIVSNVKRAYWELIFSNEDVKVKEQSLALAEKLYNDNKRQVEIGTLAPIEVVRAEAEVARTRQDLIVSQTGLLQQQITLKNLISTNPNDPLIALVDIVPTDKPDVPATPEILPVQDAIQVAMEKRPEVVQSQLDLKNRSLAIKGARNAMLPTVNAFAFYAGRGLSGIGGVTDFDPVTGDPIGRTLLLQRGYGTALTQSLQGDFPDYGVGLSITIPIRNRVAQADMTRAEIEERQAQTRYQAVVNGIIVEVRNAQIALEQDRARIDAAKKARDLAQQTLDAEQKKFQLGASTIFLVIQAQRDLAAARSAEVRAMVDFEDARVAFDRALGRTLEKSGITMEDARSGVITGRSAAPTPKP